jgi:hypothetical protein
VAIVAVWLSSHALQGARHGDSGAYFLPTVHWYVAHRIVPGLGNLHGHFALNQSYFLYVAALEAGPFAGRSFHLANGMLILMLAVRTVLALERVLRVRRAARLEDLYYVCMTPGILALVVSIFFTSPSPDVAVFALGTVCSGELIALLADDPRRRVGRLRMLVLLAVVGVTVKLSFLGFAAALLLTAAGIWWARDRPPAGRLARELGVATLIGLAAFGPWIARNIVMSGFPFFPSAVIVLPVEWRVQTDVEGWLRNSVHPAGALAMFTQPRWFLQMLVRQEWNAPDVAGPLAVGFAGLLLALARRAVRRGGTGALPLAATVPALASLLFCLMMSPVPRYAGATMWILAATGVLAACGDRLAAVRSVARAAVLVIALGATALALRTGMYPLWSDLHDFETMGLTRYEPQRLESGLVVNVRPSATRAGRRRFRARAIRTRPCGCAARTTSRAASCSTPSCTHASRTSRRGMGLADGAAPLRRAADASDRPYPLRRTARGVRARGTAGAAACRRPGAHRGRGLRAQLRRRVGAAGNVSGRAADPVHHRVRGGRAGGYARPRRHGRRAGSTRDGAHAFRGLRDLGRHRRAGAAADPDDLDVGHCGGDPDAGWHGLFLRRGDGPPASRRPRARPGSRRRRRHRSGAAREAPRVRGVRDRRLAREARVPA